MEFPHTTYTGSPPKIAKVEYYDQEILARSAQQDSACSRLREQAYKLLTSLETVILVGLFAVAHQDRDLVRDNPA